MLIFKNIKENQLYIYIHIPKNGGKFIRNKIKNNKNNEIIKEFWGVNNKLDLAHIPYMKKEIIKYFWDLYDKFHLEYIPDTLKEKYSEQMNYYLYITYTRNPYDRIISAFFYKNNTTNIQHLKNFCKNELPHYDFNFKFNYNWIHYYPQYLFLCDKNCNISKDIDIKKLEEHEKPKRYNLIQYLDNECIEIINKVYKNDFTLLNYEMINKL